MLSLINVHKAYASGHQRLPVLRGVSLEIPEASCSAVMGPSGCGKSTLLHLMAGLDEPTEGEIVFDGRRLSDMNDDEKTLLRRQKIGVIYQSFNLLPAMNVLENVQLPLVLLRRPREEIQDRAMEVLDAVGLASLCKQNVNELSGGEQQRVAIARALAARPRLLLADEPTGNLDSQSARQVQRLLSRLPADHNAAVLMVTHSMELAASADRIFRMKDGRILEHP